jgi:hypothetical protein
MNVSLGENSESCAWMVKEIKQISMVEVVRFIDGKILSIREAMFRLAYRI